MPVLPRAFLPLLLALSWTPLSAAQTVPDSDLYDFEGGVQQIFLVTADGSAPVATLELSEDPQRVHDGIASLEFQYQRQQGSTPLLIAQSLLTDLMAIRMWVYSEQSATWVLGHEDRDGSTFFALVSIPAGQWKLVDLTPADFAPGTGLQRYRPSMLADRNGAGFFMFDLASILGPAGPNTIWIDQVEVERPPLNYIAGPLVLQATDHLTITQPTLIDGDLLSYVGGTLVSSASRLVIKGDITSAGTGSKLSFKDGTLRLEQDYRYQATLWADFGGRLVMEDLLFSPGAMAGLGVSRNGSVQITGCSFHGGSFTGSVMRGGSITIDDSDSPGEFLIYSTGELIAEDVEELIFWAVADDGLTATLDIPDWNDVTWDLPASWNRHVSFTNVGSLFPALIVSEGCDITVQDGDLRVVGVLFETTDALLSNYQNGSSHLSEVFDWPLRSVTFQNVNVETWNFYSFGSTQLEIRDSLFGEGIAFGQGSMRIFNSTCDGTGGYLGARDDGTILLHDSDALCEIICDGNSFLGMWDGRVTGRVTAAEDATIGFDNCLLEGPLVELDNGQIVVR